MPDPTQGEIFFAVPAFLILVMYHAHWLYLIRRKPMFTAMGLTNYLRGRWVAHIMEDSRDILAVQTLRNWVMASSSLASTGILICLGLLSLAASPARMAEITPSLQELVREHRPLWLFKLTVFGPIWMWMGTVILTIILYRLDRQA